MNHLKRLVPYILRQKWLLIFGAILTIAKTVAMVEIPGLTREGIDAIAQDQGMDAVYRAVGLIVLYGIAFWVLTFGMRMLIIGASRKMEFALRNDFFQHLINLSPSYYDRQHTGDLVTRTNSDVSQVRELLGPGLMYPLEVLVLIPLAGWQMLQIDPQLTLFVVIPVGTVSVLTKIWTRKIRAMSHEVQEQVSDLTTMTEENISGIRVIKAYTREESEVERFRAANDEFLRRNLRLARLQGVIIPSLLFLAQLGTVIILLLGGISVIRYQAGNAGMTLGQLAEFLMLLSLLTMPMIALGWVLNVWERGMASLERVCEVLDQTPLIETPAEPVDEHTIAGTIEARGLTFTYPGTTPPVLRDVSFSIKAGQTLAIVGHTGSGKSTLAHLLTRLYPVQRGMLFVDGIDINDFAPGALRKQIGFVSQEPFLFAEPLIDNLCFGLEHPNYEHASDLAEVVALDADLQEFSVGFDTMIGERGITLSGGQRGRTALARALAIDPPVLILDDALSAVDTHTEDQILTRLRGIVRQRTTIIIAHRISTVMLADKIIVLREGRVTEEGTHEELVRQGGEYAQLYQQQLLSEQLERGT